MKKSLKKYLLLEQNDFLVDLSKWQNLDISKGKASSSVSGSSKEAGGTVSGKDVSAGSQGGSTKSSATSKKRAGGGFDPVVANLKHPNLGHLIFQYIQKAIDSSQYLRLYTNDPRTFAGALRVHGGIQKFLEFQRKEHWTIEKIIVKVFRNNKDVAIGFLSKEDPELKEVFPLAAHHQLEAEKLNCLFLAAVLYIQRLVSEVARTEGEVFRNLNVAYTLAHKGELPDYERQKLLTKVDDPKLRDIYNTLLEDVVLFDDKYSRI